MHVPGGPSCDDGLINDGRCGVARGRVSYRAAVETLRVLQPGLVEGCAWREMLRDRQDQRARNLRLNGIH